MSDDLEGQELAVLEGKDGWLFAKKYVDDGSQALYTNPQVLSDFILRRWARTFELRHRKLAALGIPLVTLIAPEAPAVRADKLPDAIQLLPLMPCERIKALMAPDIADTLLYPRDILMQPNPLREPYWPVDPHWSEWGAYLAYQALMQRVRQHLPNARVVQDTEITWAQRKTYGVLGPVMTPERHCMSPVIAGVERAQAITTQSILTEKRDCIVTVEVDDPSLPTALIFMDSFSTAMVPLLRESFRRTVFVSSQWIYDDLIEEIRPDIVIYERAERGFLYPVSDADAPDCRERFGDLRLGNEEAMAAQRRCRTELAANRLDSALQGSDEALKKASPGSVGLARAHAVRAQIHLKQHNPQAAYEALLHAHTLEPTCAQHLLLAGEISRKTGDKATGLILLRRAQATEPGAPKYREALAKALTEDQHYDEAIEQAHQAREADPHRLPPYLLLSKALADAGRPAEGLPHAEAAAAIDGSNVFVQRNLASLLMHNAHWQRAMDVMQSAQQRHTGQADLDPFIEICKKNLESAHASGNPKADPQP